MNYPKVFFIELTQNCNLYCTMCRPQVLTNPSWHMSDALLSNILDIVKQHAQVVDLRGWGESSIDDRLISVSQELHDKNIITRLYTNLNTRDSSYWVELSKTGIQLAISIESGDKDVYSKLRRGGSLTTVIKNVTSIIEASRKDINILKPYYSVVLSENNIDNIETLIRLSTNTGIELIELNPISCRDITSPTKRRTGFPTTNSKEVWKKLVRFERLATEENIKVLVAANMFSEGRKQQYSCIHPWEYCCISYDGNITFCDHLMHNKNAIMGNLNQESFEEIWFSSKYSYLREQFAQRNFTKITRDGLECEWCYHNRYGNFENLIAPNIAPIELKQYLNNNRILFE